MENKEEIKRIDGKYYLVRELETEGGPVKIDGEMMQLIKSIDDDDCQHCCRYETDDCGSHCIMSGFFVRVLPENGEEKDAEKLSNVEETGENLETEKEETMERKIGEICEIGHNWYQCLPAPSKCELICDYCDLNGSCIDDNAKKLVTCSGFHRMDNTYVIFKKLEKVEEPYEDNGKIYQLYKLPMRVERLLPHPEEVTFVRFDMVQVEIKQTEEDMEEKKLNFRPFSLEAAKAGKPVCTRDGRKARIVCFDRTGKLPVVALVESNGKEDVYFYLNCGKDNENVEKDYDLMMLPVKKEGWVNVYREETNNNERLIEQTIYKTRKDAFDNACPRGYVDTVKVEWEE